MTSLGNATITIERDYFDTLVRRARLNGESFDNESTSSLADTPVAISRSQYDGMIHIVKQYANLRRNLLRGGVDEATVDLLSQDDNSIQDVQSTRTSPSKATTQPAGGGGARLDTATPQPERHVTTCNPYSNAGNSNGGYGARYQGKTSWADAVGDEDEEDPVDGEETPGDEPSGDNYMRPQAQAQRLHFERQCDRTIQLFNLAEGTTHADITSVVRGGMVLDIFLRAHERSATVSFLHSADAHAFLDHVRRHDLYLKNKRVEVRWNDRQFILPGHVSSKVAVGATRNLVVHQIHSRHTEDSIRDDLNHIHNLVVVKIEFLGSDCFIHLNSVNNAIYARTCMMSRFKYKGSRIEWHADECAQPFDRVPAPVKRKEAPAPRKASAPTNRFQALQIEDSDEDEIATVFQSKKSVGIAA